MIIIINIIREKRSIVQQKDWMSWYPVIQSHQPPRQTLWRDGHIDTDVHGTRFSVLFESTTVITLSSVLSTYHDGHIDTDVHGTRFNVLFESTTVITPSSVLSTYHDGHIDTDVHGTRFSVLFESTTVITPSSVLSTYHRQNEPPSLPREQPQEGVLSLLSVGALCLYRPYMMF